MHVFPLILLLLAVSLRDHLIVLCNYLLQSFQEGIVSSASYFVTVLHLRRLLDLFGLNYSTLRIGLGKRAFYRRAFVLQPHLRLIIAFFTTLTANVLAFNNVKAVLYVVYT